MQSAVGRPGPSYSSPRPGQLPYPVPGTVRPAQLRQPGHSSTAGGHRSSRAVARDRWARLLNGPAFLEPGPSNRLVLSLRSCVPADVDFALERLIQVSSIDPDLMRLVEFPGLLDGLLSLVRDYLDRRRHDRTGGAQTLPAVMFSEARDMARRRAAEAALVLRNLALEKRSLEPLVESKRLRKTIVDVLDEGEIEGPEGEETTEVRLLLLEVLEIVGDRIALAVPGHAIPPPADADEDAPPPKPEPLDAPSVRLFPLLVALTRSRDRALLLAAYRCLTVLSLHDKSDLVFALLAYDSLPPLPKRHPHPIHTAIDLLPLPDPELNAVLLDFIYQHTLLPSNAAYFCARPKLAAVLRLVCSKFHLGARIEHVETDILQTTSEGSTWYKAQAERSASYSTNRAGPTSATGESLLSHAEMAGIIHLNEPDRAIAWMRMMYEMEDGKDITQVSLWTAYKTQFEPRMGPSVPPMLAAQDVIKHSSAAHPTAVPTIVEEEQGKKFIIKGIKVKARNAGPGECCWQGCPVPSGHDSTLAFHHHVYNTHLAVPAGPPAACAWSECTYVPSASLDDTQSRLADLVLHARVHLPPLPSYPPALKALYPTLDVAPSSSSTPSSEQQLRPTEGDVPPAKLHHVRYHAQLDDQKEPSGPGFLACLILRNLARAGKLARDATGTTLTDSQGPQRTGTGAGSGAGGGGGGRVTVASGSSAVGRLAEGEQSIFEAFAQAEEASTAKKGSSVANQVEKVDWSIAVPVLDALDAVRDDVVRTALSDAALGKYLAEVVATVEGSTRTTQGAMTATSATTGAVTSA
ncbi:hypothetical protein JCM10212_002778 [Sporobolomyces blumeae]